MKKHYLAFTKEWFIRHQRKLVPLLNAPILGTAFRKALAIYKDLPKGSKVNGILPNCIHYYVGNKQFADFRTHPKFSKRMYEVFKPFWWAAHFWDWIFADRFSPELSFGFATLTTHPDPDPEVTTFDGYGTRTTTEANNFAAFATGPATTVTDSSSSIYCYQWQSQTSNFYLNLSRGIYLFDTSSLTASANVSSATIEFYVWLKQDDALPGYPSGFNPMWDIHTASVSSNVAIALADYSNCGNTTLTQNPKFYSATNVGAYNSFPLSPSIGVPYINKTGVTAFSSRSNPDSGNPSVVDPPKSFTTTSHFVLCFAADTAGTSQDPKLVVEYVLSGLFTPKILFI
jgi:hypothetical protein